MKKHKGKLAILGVVLLYGTYKFTWSSAFFKGMAVSAFDSGYDLGYKDRQIQDSE